MIIYVPDPLELLNREDDKHLVNIKLPSGGHLTAESVDYKQWKVVDICSTDPMDYMDARQQPGSVIGVEDIIK